MLDNGKEMLTHKEREQEADRLAKRCPMYDFIQRKECWLCHGSGLGQMRGKRGRIDIVYCPECLGNGYNEV